jgi:hypothetical protein
MSMQTPSSASTLTKFILTRARTFRESADKVMSPRRSEDMSTKDALDKATSPSEYDQDALQTC